MEDIFTNLTKGYTDKEIKKDNIYQSGINELERTFSYKPEELSVKTIKLEPFYSNLFQSLISDEAEKRFEKAFYRTEPKQRKANETVEDLNKFIDNLQEVVYEIDNVKSLLFCGDIHGEFAELVCTKTNILSMDVIVECSFITFLVPISAARSKGISLSLQGVFTKLGLSSSS